MEIVGLEIGARSCIMVFMRAQEPSANKPAFEVINVKMPYMSLHGLMLRELLHAADIHS